MTDELAARRAGKEPVDRGLEHELDDGSVITFSQPFENGPWRCERCDRTLDAHSWRDDVGRSILLGCDALLPHLPTRSLRDDAPDTVQWREDATTVLDQVGKHGLSSEKDARIVRLVDYVEHLEGPRDLHFAWADEHRLTLLQHWNAQAIIFTPPGADGPVQYWMIPNNNELAWHAEKVPCPRCSTGGNAARRKCRECVNGYVTTWSQVPLPDVDDDPTPEEHDGEQPATPTDA